MDRANASSQGSKLLSKLNLQVARQQHQSCRGRGPTLYISLGNPAPCLPATLTPAACTNKGSTTPPAASARPRVVCSCRRQCSLFLSGESGSVLLESRTQQESGNVRGRSAGIPLCRGTQPQRQASNDTKRPYLRSEGAWRTPCCHNVPLQHGQFQLRPRWARVVRSGGGLRRYREASGHIPCAPTSRRSARADIRSASRGSVRVQRRGERRARTTARLMGADWQEEGWGREVGSNGDNSRRYLRHCRVDIRACMY